MFPNKSDLTKNGLGRREARKRPKPEPPWQALLALLLLNLDGGAACQGAPLRALFALLRRDLDTGAVCQGASCGLI